MQDRVNFLIETLLDEEATSSERDDAAMDLGNFDDDRALCALLSVATDRVIDRSILDVCGESIAQIWVSRNQFDQKAFHKLQPTARHGAEMYVKANKPEWLKYIA